MGKFDFCLLSLLDLCSLPLPQAFDFTYFKVNLSLFLRNSTVKGVKKMNKFSGTRSKIEGAEDLTYVATEVSKD